MTDPGEQSGEPSVAIVGGGLAGLAVAVALCERGLRVALFEARRRLGGRAGSFRDPHSGQSLDHCQHVSMGCCTNLADFCRRTGIAGAFRRHRRLHFIGPEGTRHDLAAVGWLPAPLHLLPGLLRLGYLRLGDRLGIARAMARLARLPGDCPDFRRGAPCAAWSGENGTVPFGPTIGRWLRGCGQSEEAIRGFWSVVLVSALSETLDRASLAAARKVLVDGFLASARAYEIEIPEVPLSEIYDRRLGDWLAAHRVEIHRGTRVGQIEGGGGRAEALRLADGSRRQFDFFVAAVPWRKVRGLLAEPLGTAIPSLERLGEIHSASITAVHLWFDRPITPLAHAVLVGRLGQWVFNKGTRPLPDPAAQPAHCYQVVISASHELAGRRREEVVAQVRGELEAIWPEARGAALLGWRMVTEPEAVFSVRPGLDRLRPAQQTPVANLMLAGDWTATGWPATMEGAVRSGYLAAEAILRALGREQAILAPDAAIGCMARWLIRRD